MIAARKSARAFWIFAFEPLFGVDGLNMAGEVRGSGEATGGTVRLRTGESSLS